MLNAIRKRASSWVVKVFFVLLIASFAVWGIGDTFFGGGQSQVAATVGDSEIGVNEVSSAFQAGVERLQDQLGTAVDREQAVRLGLMDQALQDLISQRLLDLGAADLGLRIADDTVRQSVFENPLFQTGNRFDRARFENILMANGLTEEGFLALVRRDALRAALVESLAGPVEVPGAMVDRLYRHRNERRSGRLLLVTPERIEEVPQPTAEELAAYHAEHEAEFTAPEYRALTYVSLEPEDLIEEVQVDEGELRAEYEERISEYTNPERRTVQQLLAQDEAALGAAAERVAEGVDFATAAAETPGVSASELGQIARGELPADLEAAVFGLAEGEVGRPVRSEFGWHLFRVTALEPEQVTPFEEVRDELQREIAAQRAIDRLPPVANALDDELAAGEPLEEAAANVGLEARAVEAVDARGRTPEGQPAGLPPWPEFLETAFAAEPGEPTLLNETADGAYFVVRVDRVTEPRLKPLDEVRDEAAAAWTAARRDELARQRAEDLRAQAEAAPSLDQLAGAAGLEVRTIGPLRRIDPGTSQGVDRAVVAALFDTRPGEVADRVVEVGGGYGLVATTEVLPADPAADEAGVRQLRDELAAGMRDDLLRQFEAALRDRHPVDINNRALSDLPL
ncbi:MAG TPA: SurA N-terminal domain-containing protein [Geminicoccaceae bacterium]|nr:SurA N-terminal domain-containing protein [Geminicoccaceae bacterium]